MSQTNYIELLGELQREVDWIESQFEGLSLEDAQHKYENDPDILRAIFLAEAEGFKNVMKNNYSNYLQ